MASDLPYLRAYPVALQEQARDLLEQGQLANVLLRKYPQPTAYAATRPCTTTCKS